MPTPGLSGREWKGLVKDRQAAQLDVGQSQDCSNVFFYDDQMGVLGPRRGRAYQNTTQYTDAVNALFAYRPGNGNSTLFSFRNDGTAEDLGENYIHQRTNPSPGDSDSPVGTAIIESGFEAVSITGSGSTDSAIQDFSQEYTTSDYTTLVAEASFNWAPGSDSDDLLVILTNNTFDVYNKTIAGNAIIINGDRLYYTFPGLFFTIDGFKLRSSTSGSVTSNLTDIKFYFLP